MPAKCLIIAIYRGYERENNQRGISGVVTKSLSSTSRFLRSGGRGITKKREKIGRRNGKEKVYRLTLARLDGY